MSDESELPAEDEPQADARPSAPDEASNEDETSTDAAAESRLRALVMGALQWSAAHRIRSMAIAGTFGLLIAGTFVAWLYMANLAVEASQLTLEEALESLDAGHYEEARALVRRMLKSGSFPRSDYGGPLFVLGAIKANDAELQTVRDRRPTEYLVASRYLLEAQHYGFPPDRASHGLFLLGKSLLESHHVVKGIEILEDALERDFDSAGPLATETHRLLAEAYLALPKANVEKALAHNTVILEDERISADERADTLLARAGMLARLNRFKAAYEAVAAVPSDADRLGYVQMTEAHLRLAEVKAEQQHGSGDDVSRWATLIDEAIALLKEAQTHDQLVTYITRRALYFEGIAYELKGDVEAALRQFTRVRQLYSDSQEGFAAALAEADVLRGRGNLEAEIIAYRRVLENAPRPEAYRSDVLPLEQLQERVMAAVVEFVDAELFQEAMTLLDRFDPLFSRANEMELRGETLQKWGEMLIAQAAQTDPKDESLERAGFRRLREAAVAYEKLAKLRFATKEYTDDLWKSAENFYRGHNFTSTVRLLTEYLNNEPERRNSQALMRLGQTQLALGQVADCISSLEECIEFNPRDPSTYQARIDCAKAYVLLGETDRAERLLQENLRGSALKPSSPEWKDSLYALGMLLHETGRNEEAISTLEEAIQRYPYDSQNMLAQYLIGESYRHWGEEPLTRLREARTASEREKNGQLVQERLGGALDNYKQVQRNITLKTHDIHSDPLLGAMLRNCYMLEGTVLFDLERYKDAITAYSNVSSLYPHHPFVLETFVQIAHCWYRLSQPDKARGALQQAQIALERLPAEADFSETTAFSQEEWRLLLADISQW